MNLEEAKKLKYGDKITIIYCLSVRKFYGTFVSLTHFGKQYYIHYHSSHSPPGQKAFIEEVSRGWI